MKGLLIAVISCLFLLNIHVARADESIDTANLPVNPPMPQAMQCMAFSPYVGELNPTYGPPPSKELIERLLDQVITQTPYRCIMTYGVMDGLEQIFPIAEARQLKVISIIWLDNDRATNTRSIASGIEMAKAYPETIIKLSCGSEVRTRHNKKFDGEILRCMDSLHRAGVSQPITTIDTWWEWCDRKTKCRKNSFANKVDWIGTNIFPWWENKFSGVHPCTTAQQAADYHINRLTDLHKAYPGKEIIMTEFGWPNGPEGGSEMNDHTGQHCGIANKTNQTLVVQTTFKKLAEKNWSGVVFEAFSESWKPGSEGLFGSYWGICQGEPPYSCTMDFMKTVN
jgi:exo-beta-1,3-glucanase (GH17 family)